jgi:uncharacterized protein YkwD
MARALLTVLLATAAACLSLPLSAQARTPCPDEQATPTALNSALVSDAIFCLSNQVRANYGLPAFRRDARLDTAARLQSLDMSVRTFFNHTNPDGLSPNDRAVAQGYTLGVGENIATGYATARDVVLGWMASAGHCRNLLSGAIDFGVGTAVSSTPYYTQEFGDYYSQWVDEAPSDGCPYALDLDALTVVAPRVPVVVPVPQPVADVPPAAPTSAPPAVDAAQRRTPATRPALSALSLSPARFRAGSRGTTISFRLSSAATVTFRVERAQARGARYRTVAGSFVHRSTAGDNTLRLTGRLGTKTLRPGRYRLQAVAKDTAGTASEIRRVAFTVVRR